MITRVTCRTCEGRLEPVLSLGEHFVSDFPSPEDGDGTKAPLDLVLCHSCKLLQLRHTVPAETLYRNYWYRSGTNRTMREALADITHQAERLVRLSAGQAVLDIGCNDGTLLNSYRTQGIMRVGFDPAMNLSQYSRQVADKVVSTFFGAEAYHAESSLRGVRPLVVTSIAMFYDLEDPNRFVSDVKTVMDDDGLWIVQMSSLALMLKQNAFDNICHEHLEYYSLGAMEALLKRHDMRVVDVEENDVNGGSFRLYIRNADADKQGFGDETYRALSADRLDRYRQREMEMKLDSRETYQDFAFRVSRIKRDVVEYVQQRVASGKKVFVYGASTKGNTLLQYFGLTNEAIRAAADRNPAKWGRVTVGTRVPIISEEQARALHPDYFLVLPWHFIEEFEHRERDYLYNGGRFIVPMPHFSLL